eukprot:5226388-Prymnesium_polylepis.3
MSAQSGRSIPKNTPVSPSVERRCDVLCNALLASAGDTWNAPASKYTALETKPPCCVHATCAGVSAATSTACDSVQRDAGTCTMASPHVRQSSICAASTSHPPGNRPTAPARTTGVLDNIEAVAAMTLADGGAVVSSPRTHSSRCSATARGVGCSNWSVFESSISISARSRNGSSAPVNDGASSARVALRALAHVAGGRKLRPPSAEVRRRWTKGWGGLCHEKAHRRYVSGGGGTRSASALPATVLHSTACAIVPLKPNELTPAAMTPAVPP